MGVTDGAGVSGKEGDAVEGRANGEAERLLAMGDALAARLEASAAPVRFRVAASPTDLEAIYRFRCRTVVESGWADPGDFPDGLERDAFDQRALQIGGWNGELLAAAARLVFPAPGVPLPTEEAFQIEVEPRGRVVDVGRGIVDTGFRAPEHRVLLGLLARCWLELRAKGFSAMCGDAAPWLIQIYRSMGFTVDVLGPPQPFWGEERCPIHVDGLASVRAVIERLARDATTGA